VPNALSPDTTPVYRGPVKTLPPPPPPPPVIIPRGYEMVRASFPKEGQIGIHLGVLLFN